MIEFIYVSVNRTLAWDKLILTSRREMNKYLVVTSFAQDGVYPLHKFLNIEALSQEDAEEEAIMQTEGERVAVIFSFPGFLK